MLIEGVLFIFYVTAALRGVIFYIDCMPVLYEDVTYSLFDNPALNKCNLELGTGMG